jgi:hypothetical protein
MAKLLLHTCCGPCFLGTWEDIRNKFDVTNLFYNPNIQPEVEYWKRLDGLKLVADGKSKEVVVLDYRPGEHRSAILGLEKRFPERCINCYALRLTKTAKEAKKLGFDLFSTTLLISPYQQHETLKNLGEKIACEVGVEFYYTDWRPLFREGQSLAKEKGIYRQRYCGCSLSEEEAENNRNKLL